MHGRVKVRTSEEEKARKEKERQEKLKIFNHAMQKILQKRQNAELDRELLELTGKVLSSNPDIYTLWNIRREIINILRKDESPEELSKTFDGELHLTLACLKINPKSYCAWYQREWVLTTRVDPDWNEELILCNTYLKLDERNFHTWDYRRFVVSHCKPPLKDEFDYTTEKLYDNFSNYSAWHYRSKMLIALYPGLKGGRPIEDSHHKHELKMVQNAAFTDPDDTSAWFYQRWLLGAVKTTKSLVVYTVSPSKTTFAFSTTVDKEFVRSNTTLLINDEAVEGEWRSCTGNLYDTLWILKHGVTITDALDVKVKLKTENGETEMLPSKQYGDSYIGKSVISFQRKYSEPVLEELKTQLDSCRQLLALEPDSKWTMLTTAVFLHCIDAKSYHKEVIGLLQNLKVIDKLRAGYYGDLITKWSIEEQLGEDYKTNDGLDLKISFIECVTSLPHMQYYSYCRNIDLSDQNLTSKVLPSLVVLQHCKTLSLKNNKLTTLKNFPALDLEELNLEGNELHENEIEAFNEKYKYRIIL